MTRSIRVSVPLLLRPHSRHGRYQGATPPLRTFFADFRGDPAETFLVCLLMRTTRPFR